MLFILITPSSAYAGVEQLSEKEFRELVAELAPKVNLFRAVWTQDPRAEFYGGSSRDFLYWVKGKFQTATTPTQAREIANELRALPVIDVREFIIGDSDVDVISEKGVSINAGDYSVRKFDHQPTDIFDPQSEAGFNELNQGYAPAEKIRLAKNGLIPNPGLGDGAQEIYTGKLTVHFAEPELFAKTKYAQEGINHPVLLALRYVRLQAINYFRTHGGGFPDPAKLGSLLDPASAAKVKEVIQESMKDNALKTYLARPKFQSWANGTIQKAFRSYTNPTAALELMKYFTVDDLVNLYSGKIDPINQYVFAKYRNEKRSRKLFNKRASIPTPYSFPRKKSFPMVSSTTARKPKKPSVASFSRA